MPTTIKKCPCKNGPNGVKTAASYQEEKYGGKVYNVIKREGKVVYRCTVCGREESTTMDVKEKIDKKAS